MIKNMPSGNRIFKKSTEQKRILNDVVAYKWLQLFYLTMPLKWLVTVSCGVYASVPGPLNACVPGPLN